MRTYSKTKLMSILALFIFLIACNKSEKVDVYKAEYPVGIYDYSFSETGFLHKDFDNQWIAFFDFEKKTSMPICTAAECIHDNENCNAKQDYFGYFIHGDKFYAFKQKDEMKSIGDNKTTTITQIIKSDIGGTNMKVLTEFEGINHNLCSAPRDSSVYIHNNVLYFTVESSISKNYVSDEKVSWSLMSFDLESEKLTEIAEIINGYHSRAVFLGMSEQKAYYHCTYTDEEIDYNSYKDVEDFLNAVDEVGEETFLEIDLATGEVSVTDLPNIEFSSRIFANTYFYNDSDGFYSRNLITDEVKKIHDEPASENGYYATGDTLFINVDDKSYMYDLKKENLKEMQSLPEGKAFTPLWLSGKFYYGYSVVDHESHVDYVEQSSLK